MRVGWRKAGRQLRDPAQYLLICNWKDTDSPASSRFSTLTNIVIPIWKRENPKSLPECPPWAQSSCSKATIIILHLHAPGASPPWAVARVPSRSPYLGVLFHGVTQLTECYPGLILLLLSTDKPLKALEVHRQVGRSSVGVGCPICLQKTCRSVVGEGGFQGTATFYFCTALLLRHFCYF